MAIAAMILILEGKFHLDCAARIRYSVAERMLVVDTPCGVAGAIFDITTLRLTRSPTNGHEVARK
jgi:hypothetical protein